MLKLATPKGFCLKNKTKQNPINFAPQAGRQAVLQGTGLCITSQQISRRLYLQLL